MSSPTTGGSLGFQLAMGSSTCPGDADLENNARRYSRFNVQPQSEYPGLLLFFQPTGRNTPLKADIVPTHGFIYILIQRREGYLPRALGVPDWRGRKLLGPTSPKPQLWLNTSKLCCYGASLQPTFPLQTPQFSQVFGLVTELLRLCLCVCMLQFVTGVGSFKAE